LCLSSRMRSKSESWRNRFCFSPTSDCSRRDTAASTLLKRPSERAPGFRALYSTGQGVTDGMRALFVENSGFLPKP
jgi:hypothetical protein